jgi:hypothetical protein
VRHVLGREVAAGELELECARKVRAIVMLSQSTRPRQRVGIGKRPAPTVEADQALELSDRLALNRLAVKS